MKKLILLTLLNIFSLIGIAQNKLWYLSDKAGTTFGMNFSGGNPTSFNTGTPINLYESLTMQSDVAGNMLWYSDGMYVYNKNHAKMPANAVTPLQGTIEGVNNNPPIASAVQGALSFKWPGSTTKYLLFTTQSCDGARTQGWRYHVIDMSLNGGLGDISSKDNLLMAGTAEMQTFYGSCDSVWVVTHGINNNNFYSVLVTSAGVGSVVTSTVATPNKFDNGISDAQNNASINFRGARGSLAINSLGNKIAMTGSHPTGTHVLKFNRYTGVVSGPQIELYPPAPQRYDGYGTEWSPDGNILYVSSFEYERILHYNSSTNVLTELSFVSTSIAHGEIVTGPNGVLYIAKREEDYQTHLATITNPNSTTPTAVGIGYTENGYSVGNYVMPGLPQIFTCPAPPACLDTTLNNTNVSFCAGGSYNLNTLKTGSTSPGNWSVVGSGSNWPTVAGTTLNTTTSTPAGTYTVRYTLSPAPSPGCPTYSERTFVVNALPNPSLANKSTCSGTSTTFDAGAGYTSYTWSGLGTGTQQTTTAQNAGTYTVTVTNANNCSRTVSATLTVNSASVNISDQSVCVGTNASFSVPAGSTSYSWTGPNAFTANTNSINVSTTGKYKITIVANGCSASDSAILGNYTLTPIALADVSFCSGSSATISASNYTNHQWSGPNGFNSTSSSVATSVAGTYYLSAKDNNNCTNYDTIEVTVNANPTVSLPQDTSKCFTEQETYSASVANIYNSVLWSTNESTNSITISNAGTYWVEVGNNFNCSARDTIVLSLKCGPTPPCFPNVVTPNGDGQNDGFTYCDSIPESKVAKCHMEIYDRWGLKLFTSDAKVPNWDLKFNGNEVSGGVYYYVVRFTDSAKNDYELTGWLQVIN